MRALSIKQPWASLIITGRKTIELRSWSTPYRGRFLVCASAQAARERALWPNLDAPLGVAVGIVELVDVRDAVPRDAKAACAPPNEGERVWLPSPGEKAWLLRSARAITPFPLKGKLGWMNVPGDRCESCGAFGEWIEEDRGWPQCPGCAMV